MPSVGSPPSHPPPFSACSAAKRAGRPPTGPAASTRAPSRPGPCPPRDLRHTFDRHTLDGATVRASLLELVVQLGRGLRRRGQAARALTLTLRFAGGTSWEKTRRLTEPSAHDDDLRLLAYQLMGTAGLQRGRSPASPRKATTSSTPTRSPSRSAWTPPARPAWPPKPPWTASATSTGPASSARPPPAAPPEPGPLRLERRLRDGCRPWPLSRVNTPVPYESAVSSWTSTRA
ncbi:hypothetical protein ACFY65_33250 [Streptomyces cellulosae]